MQEKTCAGVSFLLKFQPRGLQFCQKRLQHRFFSVKFAKFLRTSILQNICEWLLLKKEASKVTTLSETCHIFGVFDQNIKYLQQKIHEVMLIFVQCIKLDENKVSNRTFIRGYSDTLSYSSFFIFWSPCCLKHLISKTVYTLNN